MRLKTLPPELVRELIKGHEDLLTPLAEQRRLDITSRPCPRCQSPMEPTLYGAQPFRPDDPLPRTVARCVECGYTVDRVSGIVLEMGRPEKVEEPIHTIRPKD